MTKSYLTLTQHNAAAKLCWKAHVMKEREELGLKYKKMYWLTERRSALSIHNKLMLYAQILKPVWTDGIQLWGCTKQSNIDIIQRFQNKVLRNIIDAPWYVRNADLHRDLQMGMVTNEIGKFAKKHEERLLHHVNVGAIQLFDKSDLARRLKKPFCAGVVIINCKAQLSAP
jgi:hypothetical protein